MMATANYNEVTHSAQPTDWNSLDPLYHWDTHYPEKFSKLTLNPDYGAPAKKKNRRGRSRCSARYKTQPITFDEIKEVDEEGAGDDGKQEGFKNQLLAFSRSMDGLIPRYAAKSASLSPNTANTLSVEDMRAPATTPEGASAAGYAPSTAASGPTGSDEKLTTSGTSETTNTGPIEIPDGLLNQSAHAANFRQKRRSRKKHNRSIEELPEAEKIENANLTG